MALRLLFSFIGFFIATFFHTIHAAEPPNVGIAFIHGTSDHRQDAEGGYWQRSFINGVAAGLDNVNNVLVVACDYSDYMWFESAAGCTADQLIAFADENKIDKLVLYTHSNGANVIRWILSHPTYDPRFHRVFKLVDNVVAIGASSGGTVLAEEAINGTTFEEAVSWLLGYRNNAVKQQREADMTTFNNTILLGGTGRMPTPAPFRTIVGTDTAASPVSTSSYCNGYFRNLGLKITKMYLEKCADGFLSCSSQMAAGELWFMDKEKTNYGLALNHNQSRHNCFGLEKILSQDLQNTISQGVES